MNKIIYIQINAWFAKIHAIKFKGKKQLSKNKVTFESAEQIKKAAEKRNDKQMLIKIWDQHLIAKECHKHEKCYLNYTRILYKNESSEEPVYDRGNYECVCRIIEEDVIKFDKCISMKTIMEVYGIGKGQH